MTGDPRGGGGSLGGVSGQESSERENKRNLENWPKKALDVVVCCLHAAEATPFPEVVLSAWRVSALLSVLIDLVNLTIDANIPRSGCIFAWFNFNIPSERVIVYKDELYIQTF